MIPWISTAVLAPSPDSCTASRMRRPYGPHLWAARAARGDPPRATTPIGCRGLATSDRRTWVLLRERRLRQLGAHGPRRLDDVLERRHGLLVAAGLESAVGVDPQPGRGDLGDRALEQGLHLGGARHARRVDVVDARADAVVEAARREVVDDLHSAASRLDRRHVG